jgi:hypothetical protein
VSREAYWRQSLEEILGEHKVDLPTAVVAAIATDLAHCAEMESEAMGYSAIANPLRAEVQRIQQLRERDQRAAEGREAVFRQHIAGTFTPRVDPQQVHIKDGQIEVW